MRREGSVLFSLLQNMASLRLGPCKGGSRSGSPDPRLTL